MLVTMTDVAAEPLNAFDAVKVTLYGLPADWPTVGVQLNVPLVLPAFFAKVPPAVMAVPAAVRFVIASPSGSDADTVNVRSTFSWVVWLAGAVTTGARSTFVIVIAVAAEPLNAFDAVNVAV